MKTSTWIFIAILAIVILIGGALLVSSSGTNDAQSDDEQELNESMDDNEMEDGDDQDATTQNGQTDSAETFTMAMVEENNSQDSCYTVIRGDVYDLTEWIKGHPGGAQAILSICGTDGTSAFEGQHGGSQQQENALASFKIGTLAN